MIILSTHVTMTPNRGMKNFYNTKVDGVKVFRYSDETAEAVASGEKLLKESGTIYESFADMMSPEDAKRYLDFLENGKKTIRWYDSEGKAYRDSRKSRESGCKLCGTDKKDTAACLENTGKNLRLYVPCLHLILSG